MALSKADTFGHIMALGAGFVIGSGIALLITGKFLGATVMGAGVWLFGLSRIIAQIADSLEQRLQESGGEKDNG